MGRNSGGNNTGAGPGDLGEGDSGYRGSFGSHERQAIVQGNEAGDFKIPCCYGRKRKKR